MKLATTLVFFCIVVALAGCAQMIDRMAGRTQASTLEALQETRDELLNEKRIKV